MVLDRDRLAGDLVDELAAFLVEDALVPEVRASDDAEEACGCRTIGKLSSSFGCYSPT